MDMGIEVPPWPFPTQDTNTLSNVATNICLYSGPCDLRPPIQPAKYGLKLKVVLK